MIQRHRLKQKIAVALGRSRVVALIGPRQCGKTTLAREFVPANSINYFDLEDPRGADRLNEPMLALEDLSGLVVIDEVQRKPELFPVLRVLADRAPLPAHFLVLGSATLNWLRQSSESLAGRIEVIEMGGFSLEEIGAAALSAHWLRGGLPPSFLAATDADSLIWRTQFMSAIVERDLPMLGVGAPAALLRRFWNMLAHYHAQTWNASEISAALQISPKAARNYLDALEGAHMARQLQPWFENLGKRQVKSPKVYIRDSGLYHALMNIGTPYELLNHPKSGASWEGYALEEAIRALSLQQVYYWGTSGGAELDLFALHDGKRIGIEFKRVDAPRLTPSMRSALGDLKLDQLLVVYPGPLRYPIAERVEAVPLTALASPDILT
jgi:predicted AAA+ superfamily ATPase